MDIELILSFLFISIILTLMPGPDNIYVLTESISKGCRNGVYISLGLSSGVLFHTLAAATGISIIIKESALAFNIIKYFGAIYLIYLAIKAIKDKTVQYDNNSRNIYKQQKFIELFKQGILMNILNPKVSLFFIALLPQFVTNNGIKINYQMIILGIIFMLQAMLIFIIIAILSGKLSKYMQKPNIWTYTKWSKSAVLSILGLYLAFSNNK